MVIVLMLTYLRQTSLLLLLIFPTLLYAKVGDVIEQKGRTNIERGSDTFKEIDKEFDVESMDTVRTKDGRTSIQFIYETRVDVT